ncbi:pilus assembly protein TadG-related protein [Thaumasiovibrio sp. DFM-14]|uniref:pilus assembly protein TadG-related protein n=1 Tax=Thaumasiovibrio sp. DFM-14 TaxID=3384792 RepID=UPI0039A222AB
MKARPFYPAKQRGVVAVFATISIAVLLGAAAMALDVGNLITSKGKLQNLADTAALTAAQTIDAGGDHAAAIAAANALLADSMQLDGNNNLDLPTPIYEFSDSLPFSNGGGADAPYVRVRLENSDVNEFFVRIFNLDFAARASAVSGPSTTVISSCNVVPISICAGDETDPTSGGLLNGTGFTKGSVHVLKASGQNDDIGSGNFQAIALYDEDGNLMAGANDYRYALAGGYDICAFYGDGSSVTTEPGNMVGPSEAIDTRFATPTTGTLRDTGDIYPPDTIPTFNTPITVLEQEGSDGSTNYVANIPDNYFDYDDYQTACEANGNCNYRRKIVVPVIDCEATNDAGGGRLNVPLTTLACFFLSQPVSETNLASTSGNGNSGGGNSSWIVGEFIEECGVSTGHAGLTPDAEGPYRIVLFKDPDSEDS